MTTSRSLSWIDRGRWAGLLAKVTDEPLPDGHPAPIRLAPAGAPRTTSPEGSARRTAAWSVAVQAPPRPRIATAPMPTSVAPRQATAPLPPVPSLRPPSVPPPIPSPPGAAAPPAPPPAIAAPPAPAPVAFRPFASSSRQLDERLQALVGWIEDCVPCRAAFIADDNGLQVVEHLGADPGHIAAASSILLMLASVRTLMRDSGGWLSLKLGAQVLNVVEVATHWGRFGVGVVTDDALPREFLIALSAAVERAFHGEPSQGE